jgi:hypothetical protein
LEEIDLWPAVRQGVKICYHLLPLVFGLSSQLLQFPHKR